MNLSAVTSLIVTIASFIVAIGILVAVHEFGHFWVARRCGIRVLRFSIGFGKPLWTRIGKDGVEYMIASIPLGGYVKLLDEREGNVAPEDLPRAFNRQPVWKRIATLLAGPGANLLFAVIAYWLILMAGVPAMKPVIAEVTPGSLAAEAGIKANDVITRVGGREIRTQEGASLSIFQEVLRGKVELEVQSDGAPRRVTLFPAQTQADTSRMENLLAALGIEFWTPRIPAVIGKVLENSPAQAAGLQNGDRIVAFNGEAVKDFNTLVKQVSANVNHQATLTVERAGQTVQLPVKIGEETVDGRSVGRIGVQPQPVTVTVPEELRTLEKYGPLAAIGQAGVKTWDMSALTLQALWGMVVGKVSVKELTGPITIAEIAGSAARQGWLSFMYMLAIISISIGLLNLMPIPVLDGGQVVFQLAELVKGSPVSERMQLISQQIGVVLLMLLMSLAFYNDIARHLS